MSFDEQPDHDFCEECAGLTGENATLRAQLKEAQERVEALERLCFDIKERAYPQETGGTFESVSGTYPCATTKTGDYIVPGDAWDDFVNAQALHEIPIVIARGHGLSNAYAHILLGENATLRARVADLEAQRQSDLIDGMGHKPIIDDLRASLNEASERVKALENACRNILSLQIRIAGGLTSAAAISEAILAAGEALSRPLPRAAPRPEKDPMSAIMDNWTDEQRRIALEQLSGEPQATTGKESNLRPSQSETQSADDSVPSTPPGQTEKSNEGVSHGVPAPCEIEKPEGRGEV